MTDPYVYPGTKILRNKLEIRNARALDRAERNLVVNRAVEGVPTGSFDLKHLQAIHFHLFQDIYDWAGQIRTVDIGKGGVQFQPRRFIEAGMADVHRRLREMDFLNGLDPADFSARAGRIMGDVNYVHPFREGNGRSQLQYLKQLATHAGHRLDLKRLGQRSWIAASKEAHLGRYEAMAQCIEAALAPRK